MCIYLSPEVEMFASFLLALREGLEAALIIGIVLAALRKMDRKNLAAPVWQGTAAAVGVSILAALAFNWVGAEFEGTGEQIFEGIAMLVAAGLLTWMIVWMQRQSGSLHKQIENEVKEASKQKSSGWALFGLSFLAVGREGFELVLFLTAVEMTTDGLQTFLGAFLGLAAAGVLGWTLFNSSKRMSLRNFFNVTNVLLVLFAAGLVAHGVHEFNEAGIIPSVVEHMWNINPILDEKQPLGQIMTALFGYNGNPSLTEVLAYGLYLLAGMALWKKAVPAAQLSPAS
jgi:high-affinity iron transporter